MSEYVRRNCAGQKRDATNGHSASACVVLLWSVHMRKALILTLVMALIFLFGCSSPLFDNIGAKLDLLVGAWSRSIPADTEVIEFFRDYTYTLDSAGIITNGTYSLTIGANAAITMVSNTQTVVYGYDITDTKLILVSELETLIYTRM